jgi:hypothetical protein
MFTAPSAKESHMPVSSYDFQIRDEWDNEEFLTGATVDLIEDGKVVHTETFVASSEDAYGPAFSAYGNGRDNHAGTQARSYAWGWIESQTSTPEDLTFETAATFPIEEADLPF